MDLAYAVLTVVALRGKRYLSVDTDSMQMETALNHVHAARRFFGPRIDPRIHEDLRRYAPEKGRIRPGGAQSPSRLGHQRQVQKPNFQQYRGDHRAKKLPVYTGGKVKPPALTAADRKKLDDGLALYLILRNYMREVNAVGGGWTNQLAWGSDRRGIPLTTADIAESLFNSSEDHTGQKAGRSFRHGKRHPGLVDDAGLLLFVRRDAPTLFMDFRKVYEPWEIEKNARDLGIDLRRLQERTLDAAGIHRRQQFRKRVPGLCR